jgi:hypothetical protein
MSSLIENATIQVRRDTAANWSSVNPVMASGELGFETDTGVLKIGDGSTAWNSLTYAFGELGETRIFSTYKDRSSVRLEPFAYDNAVSTSGTYSSLYSEIGHIFNDAHVAVGDTDLSGSSTLFYPTPPPDSYGRVGIPDISIDGTSLALPSGFRDGTLFIVKSGTSQATGTELYIRRVDASTVSYHSSEDGAINNTGSISVTGTGILTQEGIRIEDAFQGHHHTFNTGRANGLSGGGSADTPRFDATNTPRLNDDATDPVSDTITDGDNGTPNVSNETRGKTHIEYKYIRY